MSKKPDRALGEKLKTEAQGLVSSGKLTAALEHYGRAAEALPGDAWLHHAAGELARKLKQDALAAMYFRKSGAAFMASGFSRYALPALRSSWLLLRNALPANATVYREVTNELAAVQRELGFETDATMTEQLGRGALDALGATGARANDSVPPRESLARVLQSPIPPQPTSKPVFRRWLERVRKVLSA